MNNLTAFTGSTMDSREIDGLTGRRHDSVLRTINKMLSELGVAAHTWEDSYIGDDGSTRPCFKLPKRECLILAAGFNIKLRAAIIDRWAELESGKAIPLVVNQFSQSLKSTGGSFIFRSAGYLSSSSNDLHESLVPLQSLPFARTSSDLSRELYL